MYFIFINFTQWTKVNSGNENNNLIDNNMEIYKNVHQTGVVYQSSTFD